LKEFVTSKADRKKNILKVPDESFRIKGEDIVIEQDPMAAMLEEIPNFQKTKGTSLYQKNKAETTTKLEEFKIIKVLGKGSFGRVYLVENISSGKTYAMKELRKDVLIDTDQIQNTKIEKEIMLNASHPFLVNLEYVFQTPGKIYFVMKFMRGGELYSILTKEKRFPESRVRFYAAQIGLALSHLHQGHIIYRDIKPENILLDDDGYLCLTDFGLARFVSEDMKAMSFCGTPEYMAPEIVQEKGHNRAADWWSFGILIYEMLVGVPPFYHQNQHTMFQFIIDRAIIFPIPEKHHITVSDAAKDLITKLLQKNPNDRLGNGPNDAEDVLKHPFFAGLDLKELMEKKIKAEYVPQVKDKYSVENFDPSITAESLDSGPIPPNRMDLIKKFEEEFKEFNKK
jgi:serum/glucocorticoid-regulated kinase 2